MADITYSILSTFESTNGSGVNVAVLADGYIQELEVHLGEARSTQEWLDAVATRVTEFVAEQNLAATPPDITPSPDTLNLLVGQTFIVPT